jgi:hypothetical protein
MNRDDRAQAGFLVLSEDDALMRIEGRVVEHRSEPGVEEERATLAPPS